MVLQYPSGAVEFQRSRIREKEILDAIDLRKDNNYIAIRIKSDHGVIALAITFASIFTPFCILLIYWDRYIRSGYFPYGDELALITHSTRFFHPSVSSWFFEGYSRYFIVYPEWTVPYTNFLRPMANTCYYVNSLLFGRHWSWYLLASYAIQSGIVALSFHLARRQFNLPLHYAIGVGMLCLVSPAFGLEALYFPSCAFDLLAALFLMVGIGQFLKRRLIFAWLFFTLAVFTKETALFAPVVAALLLGNEFMHDLKPNRFVRASFFLLPIFVWTALRFTAFAGGTGVYVFNDANPMQEVVALLHGILSWPMGMRTDREGPIFRILFCLLNASFWIAVCAGIVIAGYSKRHRSDDRTEDFSIGHYFGLVSRSQKEILYFCIGSLLLPMMLNLRQRFGALFFPLLFLLLFCILHSSSQRSFRLVAGIALVLSISVNIFQRLEYPNRIHSINLQWTMSADYIRQISQTKASTVFVMNDVTEDYASPDAVEKFAGYSRKIIPISNLKLSAAACSKSPSTTIQQSDIRDFSIISYITPNCGTYRFYGADPALLTSASNHSLDLERSTNAGNLRYLLPPSVPLPPSQIPSMFGLLSVELKGSPPDSVLLVPSFETQSYRVLHLGPQ